jgi:methylthioribose-1-phosphate isomerase
VRTIELRGKCVVIIDQSRLPQELKFVRCNNVDDIVHAIKTMQIRGAPALGVAAAMVLAVTAINSRARSTKVLLNELKRAANKVRKTRPTAVNLFGGLDRVLKVAQTAKDVREVRDAVVREARRIAEEDVETNRRMGELGASLIKDGDVVLTHCNTGALAAVCYGTALGAIQTAWEQGKRIKVIATETRPQLQGARLTAWELKRAGIPVTVITDSMAGEVMRRRMVNLVMVGADRITSNGDVVNKIGTYALAVLAKEHGIPFYSIAPTTTIDLSTPSGDQVKIEHRDPSEVIFVGKTRLVPKGVAVFNPAFDVTPSRLVTAIVTERGIVRPSKLWSLFGE